MSNDPEFNQQAGQLGDFLIRVDGFTDTADSMGISSFYSTADDVRFWAGGTYAARASAAFNVTRAGVLRATGAIISGTITATSGTIGGFTLATDQLSSGTGDNYIELVSDVASKGYAVQVGTGGANAYKLRLTRRHLEIQYNSGAGLPVFLSGRDNGTLTNDAGYLVLQFNNGQEIILRGETGDGTFAGTVRANTAFNHNGTAGFSGTVALPTSITISGGIVTACS